MSGESGEPGESGVSGVSGVPGVPGVSGVSGVAGVAGVSGKDAYPLCRVPWAAETTWTCLLPFMGVHWALWADFERLLQNQGATRATCQRYELGGVVCLAAMAAFLPYADGLWI